MNDWISPQFVNLLSGAGVGFIVLLAAFGQYWGKRRESAAAPPSKDVIIPSLAIADRVSIEGLAEALRRLVEMLSRNREHDQSLLYELREINSHAANTARLLKEHDLSLIAELREMNKTNGRIEYLLGRVAEKMR